MQKRQTKRNLKNDGDTRFYSGTTKRRDINETDIPAATDYSSETTAHNNNLTTGESARVELQLDAAQRLLETLDEQINNLDVLQQRATNAHNRSSSSIVANHHHHHHHHHTGGETGSHYLPLKQSNEDHHRALVRAIEARKLALDYYIEHGLREDTRCGCHFEHADDSDVTADCLCASQIDCQECSFAVDEQQKPGSGGNHYNIEQQQLNISPLSEDLSTKRIGQESSYRRELFIDDDDDVDDKKATGSESELVPHQSLKAKSGGSRQNIAAANYPHYSTRATAAAGAATTTAADDDNSSIDSCQARQQQQQQQAREERILYEIERRYSQRLTGFRLSPKRHKSNYDDDDSCSSSESRISEEEQEIGNALVESDSRTSLSSNSSDLVASEQQQQLHQFERLRRGDGQLARNYNSSEQCSLTEDNNNNNRNYESENNNSSSSSLSLSWSQDFLKTLSIDDCIDQEAEEEALLLINSLFPRSCSAEGRIDLELCCGLESKRGATSYSGPTFGRQSHSAAAAAPVAANTGHELRRGGEIVHKQQQQQRRRHSEGSVELHEGCGRYNWSSAISVAGAPDELDFEQSITLREQGASTAAAASANKTSTARGKEPASASSCQLFQKSPRRQPSSSSIIEFYGGQRVVAQHHPHPQPEAGAASQPSMRAVRDIAKMSVPSLSALQYLPSQMDQLAKSKQNTTMQPKQSQDQDQSGSSGQLRVMIEETSSVKHDESCLFHRLCMCSCVSRQPLGAEMDEDNQQQKSSKKSSNRTNDSSSLRKRPKSVSPTNYGLKDEDDEDERCLAKLSEEKHSSRFLGLLLLRPGSPGRKRSSSSSSSARAAKEPKQQSQNELSAAPLNRHDSAATKFNANANAKAKVRPSDSSQLRLGSDGNLIQSRASSAQDGDFATSDTESGASRATSLSSSALAVGAAAAAAAADSSASQTKGDDNRQVRSKSACSTTRPGELEVVEDDDGGRRTNEKTKAYKRFLSPRRIFASPSRKGEKSSGGLESLVEKEATSRQARNSGQDEEIAKPRASFLSRSLTRLTSQRAASKAAQISPKKLAAAAAEEDKIADSDCCSQTISICDSVSLQSSPPPAGKHLASAAPEIVLNTVEFQQHDSISSSASVLTSTMTPRPDGGGGGGGHQSPSSLRHLMRATSGDELSVDNDRACSLPPSPRRYRYRAGANSRSARLRESPISFRSPAAMSTKIEDGLKVCSTEHFEKHIDNVKGNQDDAQAKLFRAWINHFHPNLIRHDLVDEFRDGIKLIGLLASLTRDKQLRQVYERLSNDKQSYVNRLVTTPSSRLRHLSNVSIAIDYLRQKRSMKLVNLNPMDIVSGKQNVILGLCWNIILNFQLDQQLPPLPPPPPPPPPATSDASSESGSNKGGGQNLSSPISVSYCTSRLSSSSTNEDGSKLVAAAKPLPQLKRSKHSTTSSLIEEYGTNDLISAKRKLLERINRRFNLKLTNLTSNLLDGDVLLAIMKRLVPNIKDVDSFTSHADWDDETHELHEAKKWNKMSNEEKLDCCFDIAETHLGIPRLFDGSDLNSPDGTKSSLIYLSMLLNSEQAPTVEPEEDQSSDSQAPVVAATAVVVAAAAAAEQTKTIDPLSRIESCLNEIDRVEDKFEIGQLDSTLNKIRALEKLVEDSAGGVTAKSGATKILDRCQRLKEQANQIEALIKWINEADSLLEGSQQKSSKDLTDAIEQYRQFFSPEQLPKLETSLCPTLERQYRECLSSAKQRVLSAEQTLKNWISYEEARKRLKEWLITSETKLANALNPSSPPPPAPSDDGQPDREQQQQQQQSPLARHSERLNDLIEYFELESVDEDQLQQPQPQFTSEQMPISLMVHQDHHQYDSVSLSGSLISLGSTSSRMSTLQSSKKASYHKLFDDFELKCRLLAAGLDREQRDYLLMGVKELRCRLRIITEQRVPQVVTELRMSISRCEMSIQEEHDDEDGYDEVESPLSDEHEAEEEEEDAVRSITDIERNLHGDATQSDSAILSDSERSHPSRVFSVVSSTSSSKKRATSPRKTVLESDQPPAARQLGIQPKQADNDHEDDNDEQSIVAPPVATAINRGTNNNKARQQHTVRKSPKSRKSRRRAAKGPKKAAAAGAGAAETTTDKTDDDDPTKISTARRIWKKLVEAFRTSLPLNIVLLVCLAGLCVVPMIQKDACCGLAQQQIPATSNNIKPV